MSLFDFLIIYFACGAPFGVYYAFTSRERPRTAMFYAKLFVNFFLWFQYGIRLILRTGRVQNFFDSIGRPGVVRKNPLEGKIGSIRTRIEAILVETGQQHRVFEFREEFERFVGLSLELGRASATPVDTAGEFAEISGRGRDPINERCLHRKILRQLRWHLDLSERALIDIPATFDSDRRSEISTLIEELVDLVSQGADQKQSEREPIPSHVSSPLERAA